MKSLGNMVRQLAGLVGTDDLTDWERQFVTDMNTRTKGGAATVGNLTERQIEVIEKLYGKHFGD